MAEFANATALVTTDWVAGQLGKDVRLVEVDEDTEAYASGHVPGAVALNWVTDMQDQVRRELVDRAGFEKLLGDKGIGEQDAVVLYGGNNNWFAAYAYWLFKLYGHDNVRLMDGGRKKWELEDRPLSSDRPAVTPTKYTAKDADTIVTNMIDNAIKYSPSGGDIDCRVEIRGGAALVEVTDHGIGIAREDMSTLFTRFGRITSDATVSIPGTGLGLYLSRELARMHQGDLTASSEAGEGSTFTLQLPLASAAT